MTARAPALELDLGASVPGWHVRVGVPLLVLVCAAVSGGGAVVWTGAVVIAVLVALWPSMPAGAVLPLLAALWILGRQDLLADPAGQAVRLGALVLGVHLAVALAPLAEHVAWTARVEVAVLRRAAVRVLRVQLVVQALLVLTALVRAGAGGATVGSLRVLAIPAVVLLVLLALPREWLRR